MRFVIRADASAAIGSGHVMRCLSLSAAIQRRGGETEFVTQLKGGNLATTLRKSSSRLHELAARTRTERADALDTLHMAGEADAYIVDHYALSDTWETIVGKSGSRVIAIDDLADRKHTASLIVDSTYPGDSHRYEGLTNGQLLLGTRFAMLSRVYDKLRRSPISTKLGKVPRVLVYFGASDLPGATLTALEALEDSEFRDIKVDVVVGPNNAYGEAIRQMARSNSYWRIHRSQPSFANLLLHADYAVTAGGVTQLERACLGVPGVTITVADNQVPSTTALASAGVTNYVGHFGDVTPTMIRDALATLTSSAARSREMSTAGMTIVDGLGADRVAEILLPTPLHGLTMRSANSQDVGLYYTWANEPEVRAQSLTSDSIDWNSHVSWFTNTLEDPSSYLYVLEASGLPVAQARFEQRKDSLLLAYSVDDIFRGRGLGGEVVRRAIASLPDETPRKIAATVKASNHGSLITLTRAGFVPDNSKELIGDRIRLGRMR
ncbi:UDP-2,4-diacetamido-2,4,6-trideoxy-beta-L-altropyranose hydrolase [bacterium]|nr:UDP-2,4-diacetamido-2,4,6-trideoxy-beta-L-altropyranose hydrolase [bacterium]